MIEVSALKAFPQFTREYIRNEISMANLTALLSVMPPYRGSEDDKESSGNSSSNAISRENYTHFEQIAF